MHALQSDAPDYPLKQWDVITHIGDKPIDSQGNVKVNDSLRLLFPVSRAESGQGRPRETDRSSATGRRLDVQVPVRPDGNYVIPYLMGRYPRYFIYGPMVFMPASKDLSHWLASAGEEWMSLLMTTQSPLLAREMDHPAFAGEEIVTLGYGLLPHKTSQGLSSRLVTAS